MKLTEKIDQFMTEDPVRAIVLTQGASLVQGIGCLMAAGVPAEEIREAVEQAIRCSEQMAARTREDETPGDNLDRLLKLQ